MYKNSQSFTEYVNVTIPAKGPAYLQPVSCGYVKSSPLHFVLFVLWLELFSSSKHIASNWSGWICRAKRRKTNPSLAVLWLGRKIQRFFWDQSEARTTPTVWNWSVKTQGRVSINSRTGLQVFFAEYSKLNERFTPLTTTNERVHKPFFSRQYNKVLHYKPGLWYIHIWHKLTQYTKGPTSPDVNNPYLFSSP